jgi:hypothetical protein
VTVPMMLPTDVCAFQMPCFDTHNTHAHTHSHTHTSQAHTQDRRAAAVTVPMMLPTDVCAFQMPMVSPRLPLPDQLATMDTTLGQPVD